MRVFDRPNRLVETSFNTEESPPSNVRAFTRYQVLDVLRDAGRTNQLRAAQSNWRANRLAPRRIYETAEWSDFVPVTYLEPVVEHVGYNSIATQLASTIGAPPGQFYYWKEFDRYDAGRPQQVAESQGFELKKGDLTRSPFPYVTIGDGFGTTDEELLDTPLDITSMHTRAIAAGIALERDLRMVNAWYLATSGQNAIDFSNVITVQAGQWETADKAIEILLALTIWYNSPFELDASELGMALSTTFPGGELEQLQRIGKGRITDIVMNGERYYQLVRNKTLWNKQYFEGARILDSGALSVPILGVNIWRANIGTLDNTNNWTADDSIYLIDRPNAGGGTIIEKQPLTIRNWPNPEFRRQATVIYERVGFVVQNRRAIYRLTYGS